MLVDVEEALVAHVLAMDVLLLDVVVVGVLLDIVEAVLVNELVEDVLLCDVLSWMFCWWMCKS